MLDLKFTKTEEDLVKDNEIFKKVRFGDTAPSPVDDRDFVASAVQAKKTFPKEYVSAQTEILDQGSVGSCVAHACVTALASGEEVAVGKHNDYSRGYIYGNRQATDHQTEGMVIRQALRQLNHCGDVAYVDFPHNRTYPVVKKLIAEKAEELAEKALPHAIAEYYRCYTEEEIKEAIMTSGAVIICVPVYSDFGRDLHITKTNKLSGYHALAIIGWTADDKWIVQNSWGEFWGYAGKLLMDKDYPVTEYWAIRVNELKDEPSPKKNIFKRMVSFIAFWFNKLFKRNI